MTEITLTRGKVAIIDNADLVLVAGYSWHAKVRSGCWYAVTDNRANGKWTTLLMHRLILGLRQGDSGIDHVNRNGLDNQRDNLRLATQSQNMANSSGQCGRRKSTWKGVSWDKNQRLKAGGRWRATVCVNGKYIRRYAKTEEEAATVYNQLAHEYFGAFARPNEIGNKAMRNNP